MRQNTTLIAGKWDKCVEFWVESEIVIETDDLPLENTSFSTIYCNSHMWCIRNKVDKDSYTVGLVE